MKTGAKGIIKYIGKVHFSNEEMYGIKLSASSQDANNGSIDGKSYFSVPMGYGKFVKLSEIKEAQREYEITNEGQTVTTKASLYGTIRFGDFLTEQNVKKFKGIFEINKSQSGHHGIGLITPLFDAFYIGTYNYGQNHSMILYDSSSSKEVYFVTSDEFDGGYKEKHKKALGIAAALTPQGSKITVEIDMVNRIAVFRNNDNDKAYVEMKDLPESVALVFSFGGSSVQQVTCIKQEFC